MNLRLTIPTQAAFLAAILVAFLYALTVVPIQSFIQHDDWAFILGDRHFPKWLLADGPPIGLWAIISPHIIAPEISFFGYWLLFSYLGALFAVLFGYRRFSEYFLASLLILLSSPVIELSGWPSCHFAGLAFLCISVLVLLVVKRERAGGG